MTGPSRWFLVAVLLVASAACAHDERTPGAEPPVPITPTAVTSGHAPINGLELYYESHGRGEPLILLHGGLGAIEMFGPNVEALAATRRVIAVDLQAHGRTADINRPLSYEAMADDIAELIDYLGLESADLMGYSLGGGVALQTAIRHPDRVRKLVLVSTVFRRDGWYPEILAGMAQTGPEVAEQMKATPIYELYSKIAPRVEDWPVLLGKVGDLLAKDYDWSKQVAGLAMPVLLVVADADALSPAHAVELFGLLGGGKRDAGWDGSGRSAAQLAILPGTTHYDVFRTPALAETVAPFLAAPAAH